MSDLVKGFDPHAHEPRQSFDPVPAGWYTAFVSDHETKETRRGDGRYLELVWEISEGDHRGRKVWDRLNLDNPNTTAVEIAQAALSAICHAMGVAKPDGADDLIGKEIEIKIAIQPAKGEYGPSNVVKGYRAKGGGAAKKKSPLSEPEDGLPF